MSVDCSDIGTRIGALLLGSLLGTTVVAIADDAQADLEFLEYLGSWEESDEEWLIFAAAEQESEENDEEKKEAERKETPDGEQVAELENET